MALPASVLERLHSALNKAGVHVASAGPAGEPNGDGLPLGIAGLDAVLPDQGLLRGGVVELAVAEPGALATTIALAACRAVQREATERGSSVPWCAFVDPSATLYAPGVAAAGVELERLLVVRPLPEAIGRVALRLTESPAFSLVVIDTLGIPGAPLDVALGTWPRVVRRLAMSVEGSQRTVLLLTDAAQPRPLPLPVAQRLELSRPAPYQLLLRVAKDRRGRVTSPRPIAWARSPVSFAAAALRADSPAELGVVEQGLKHARRSA
jgi:recombination protein RecA